MRAQDVVLIHEDVGELSAGDDEFAVQGVAAIKNGLVFPFLKPCGALRAFQVDEVLPAHMRKVTTVPVFSSTIFRVSPTFIFPLDFSTIRSNSRQSRTLISSLMVRRKYLGKSRARIRFI